MRDVAVLMSGGLDSTVLAHMAADRLGCVLFADFGQPAAEQERAAVFAWARGSVTCLRMEIPMRGTMATGAGVVGPRVLPARNLVLLSHAVNLCRYMLPAIREVWYGAIADDAADYPDCRPAFVDSLNATLLASGLPVRVAAPLIGYTKAAVVAKARELGVDIAATWSCYEPRDGDPCGTCNSCAARDAALR